MEETLKLILNKLDKLDVIEREVKELKKDVSGIKAGQEVLNKKVDRIEKTMNIEFTAIHNCFNIAYDKIDELKDLEIKSVI